MYSAPRREQSAGAQWVAATPHEDIFVQRYEWLRRWALTLTGDYAKAEDLLHSAFVQFALGRKPLDEIENVDGYLYGMLRRLHRSEVRRTLRAREESLSAADYESIELAFRQTDPREHLHVREELRAICCYACTRKDSSKAGSVLLLRFFHGYYPSEIAAIMRARTNAANDWLRIARREAQAFLVDPIAIRSSRANGHGNGSASPFDGPSAFLDELNRSIVARRTGECLDDAEIQRLYGDRAGGQVPCAPLAHIASCPDCRECVTRRLKLRPPADRGFGEMLGQDTSTRRNGHRGGAASGRSAFRARCEHAVEEVLEHVPSKLQIAINGAPIGQFGVESERNNLALAITFLEPPDTVEVFSEQGIRMLFMPVEPPPLGRTEQSVVIELSANRRLTARMTFDGVWPTLSVQYLDPEFRDDSVYEDGQRDRAPLQQAKPRRLSVGGVFADGIHAPLQWVDLLLRRITPRRAIAFGAAMACSIAAILVWREIPVTASALLREAARSEQLFSLGPDVIVHRTFELEERRPPSRQVVVRRRVETWKDARRQLVARRLFDERNQLIAGDWIVSGQRTRYATAAAPVVESEIEPAASIDTDRIWRLEPSAETFRSLLPVSTEPAVENHGDRFVVVYQAPRHSQGVLRATLTIPKDELRAVEQVLLIQEGQVQREYRFVETTAFRVTKREAPSAVFDPERELLGPRASTQPTATATPVPIAPAVVAPAVTIEELTRLEMRTLIEVHRLETCLIMPARVSQRDQAIRVEAQAASTACRGRVEAALERVSDTARLDLQWTSHPSADPLPEMNASNALNRVAYQILYARFKASGLAGTADRADGDAALMASLAFGRWALERGHTIDVEAHELERLVLEWPTVRLRHLDLDSGAMWQTAVRDHARRLALETAGLRLQMAPFVGERAAEPPRAIGFDIEQMQEVRRAVEQIARATASARSILDRSFGSAQGAPIEREDLNTLTQRLADAAALAAQFDRPWPIGWE